MEVVGWSAEAGGSMGGGGWWRSTAGECEQGLAKFAHSGLGFLVRGEGFFFGMNEKGKREGKKRKRKYQGSG